MQRIQDHVRKIVMTTLSVLVALHLTGCATVATSPSQKVRIASAPSGAQVTIDEKIVGETPMSTRLARRKAYAITLTLDGYEPVKTTLNRRVNGWFWGNIMLGGLIGMVVDLSTGAVYRLSPTQIDVELIPKPPLLPASEDSPRTTVAPTAAQAAEPTNTLAPVSPQ